MSGQDTFGDHAAMRNRLATPVLLVVLLAACSSGGPGAASNANPSATGSQASTGQPSAAAPAGNGKVDCTAIKTAAPDLLMVQLLAQLTSPDMVASIKAKQIGNLDVD